MPRFRGSVSRKYNRFKYRFVVMDRFAQDVKKIPDPMRRNLSLNSAFSLGVCVIVALDYVHSYEYIHAAGKASSLLFCFTKHNENNVILVVFGLASRFTQSVKYKEY
ncbi:hypothetical protein MTO96_044110 [Rhipicephalus appendiculatus]